MSSNNYPLFQMEHITFNAGTFNIIDDLSLTVEKGGITAFLGEPGGGKSSALKLLAGIIAPTQGNLYFEGKNVHLMNRKDTEAFRKRMGFMFQDSALWQNQSVYQNLELPLKIHFPKMNAAERDKKIKEVFQLVGCEKPITIRPAGLSIGEQKMIGFARAIICDPEILFLDEPTESLDERTTNIFVAMLKEFCYHNGKTLIYVSHDQDFINTFSGDKYIFDSGVVTERILSKKVFKDAENEI